MIEFKRDVYQMALTALARFLPRGSQHNRYLRSGMRPHHREEGIEREGLEPCEPASGDISTSMPEQPIEPPRV